MNWLIAFCLALLGWTTPALAADRASTPADRQILVMVKHPPDHYRPNGAYGGGYGDELARSSRQRLASRLARKYGLTLVDEWPMPMMGLDCFVMAVPDGRTTEAAAALSGPARRPRMAPCRAAPARHRPGNTGRRHR